MLMVSESSRRELACIAASSAQTLWLAVLCIYSQLAAFGEVQLARQCRLQTLEDCK